MTKYLEQTSINNYTI